MQNEIGNVTWTLDGDTLTISGAGDMESYNTFAKGRAPWFERRDLIKKIVIADGVTKIGMFAFEYCANLTEIKIPASVVEIDWYAFLGCANLTAITIPSSVKTIGNGTFSWCTSLRKIHYKAGSGFEAVLCYGNNAELIPYTPPVKKNFFVRRRHVESFAQPNPSKHTEWLGSMRTATDAVGEVIEILHALKKKSTNARR